MILYINTTIANYLVLAYKNSQDQIKEKKIKTNKNQAEKLVVKLDQFLTDHRLSASQIKGIIVADQGGTFTSLRIGILVANALAYAWQIPVQAESKVPFYNNQFNTIHSHLQKKNKTHFNIVAPKYNAEPNINLNK